MEIEAVVNGLKPGCNRLQPFLEAAYKIGFQIATEIVVFLGFNRPVRRGRTRWMCCGIVTYPPGPLS